MIYVYNKFHMPSYISLATLASLVQGDSFT
jgi:hypothetical protein